ncbi:MAG: hypothetical protein A2Z31_06310 [candidate division NC10 bacterium RBG_16_65_8]|nr:MAG: hypothetical protein A2Z31_06310 [candidate division NC10 bacterium RBG_16_65_8]
MRCRAPTPQGGCRRQASEEKVGILQERLQSSRADASMLLSARGDVQVYTCHGHPQAGFTRRVSFPKLWKN